MPSVRMRISAQNLAVICIVINMRVGESERLEIIKASRAIGGRKEEVIFK